MWTRVMCPSLQCLVGGSSSPEAGLLGVLVTRGSVHITPALRAASARPLATLSPGLCLVPWCCGSTQWVMLSA